MYRRILRERADRHCDHGIDHSALEADVPQRKDHEHRAVGGDVPPSDEGADDLFHYPSASPTAAVEASLSDVARPNTIDSSMRSKRRLKASFRKLTPTFHGLRVPDFGRTC